MNSEKIGENLRKDIAAILLTSVSADYADAILSQFDTVTEKTFIDAVVEDVTVSSDYDEQGYYNDDDIRLAIGRELVARLGV